MKLVDMKPGMHVILTLPDGYKMRAQVGRIFEENAIRIICRFDNDGMMFVTEKNAKFFEEELLN